MGVGRGIDADEGCPDTAASALGRLGFEPVPVSLAPHILQKFIPVGFGDPHEGQTVIAPPCPDTAGVDPDEAAGNPWADPPGLPPGLPVVRRWPHLTQNNEPSRLVSPQLGQRTPAIFPIFR